MRKLLKTVALAAAGLVVLAGLAGIAFGLVMSGGTPPVPPVTITGASLSNGTNFTTPATAGSTIDVISATCSTGPCTSPTFALATTGSCSGATSNSSFAVSGSNLNIGGSTVNAGSYPIGIAVTVAGASNNGVCFPFPLVGTNTSVPLTITGVTLSNGTNFTTQAPSGLTLDTLTVNCTGGTCSSPTYSLATTGSCSGATSNGSFAITGANLKTGASTINAASYPIGIAVAVTAASNTGACFPFTLVGANPPPPTTTSTPVSGVTIVGGQPGTLSTTDGTWAFAGLSSDAVNYNITLNGTNTGVGIELQISRGNLYALQNSGTWWVWLSGGWVKIFDPGGPTPPAQASAAGFTNNLLKADFTVPGGAWSNTASFIHGCGASPSTPNVPSSWHFYFTIQATSGTELPCANTTITTDPVNSNQALKLLYTAAQFNANLSTSNAATLFWPMFFTGGATNTSWLPNEFYTKIVVRMDNNSVFGQPNPGGSHQLYGVFTWWASTTVFGNSWLDEDFAEGAPFNTSCSSSSYNGSLQEGDSTGDPINFSNPTICFNGSLPSYHTIETLVTSDESTNTTFCGWMDGTFTGCTNRPFAMIYNSGYAYHRRDRSLLAALSIVNPPSLSATADLIAYIKSIEVWACPNVATAGCPGTIVDHWPFP